MLAALESVTERTDLCDLITLTADEGQAHENLGLAPPSAFVALTQRAMDKADTIVTINLPAAQFGDRLGCSPLARGAAAS
jgi:hypothetical protein